MNIFLAVLVFLQVAYGGRVYEDEDIIVSGGYGGRPVSGYGERPVTGYGTRSSIAIKRPVVLHERPAVVHERPVVIHERPVVIHERPAAARVIAREDVDDEVEVVDIGYGARPVHGEGYGVRAAQAVVVRDQGYGGRGPVIVQEGLGARAAAPVLVRDEGHGAHAAGAVLVRHEGQGGAQAIVVQDDDLDDSEGATFFSRGHGYGHEYGESGPYSSSGRYVQWVGEPTRYMHRRIGSGRYDAERRVAAGRRVAVASPVGDRKLVFLGAGNTAYSREDSY